MTVTDLLTAIYIFSVGACVGSFLNVCIYRIPLGRSVVHPGSSCPACGTPIPFYLNIPILSYLLLKGKCRFCQAPFSGRYLLVELLTALLALCLFARFELSLPFVFWSAFVSTLITVSMIDLDHQIIPDIISKPGIVIFSSAPLFLPEMTLQQTGLGILAGGGGLFIVAWLYYLIKGQEGMGGGDIKLLAMIGAATGVKGVLFTIFAGSVMGTATGGLMMAGSRLGGLDKKIPFGPFLSVGALLYIFFGDPLIGWYLGILNP